MLMKLCPSHPVTNCPEFDGYLDGQIILIAHWQRTQVPNLRLSQKWGLYGALVNQLHVRTHPTLQNICCTILVTILHVLASFLGDQIIFLWHNCQKRRTRKAIVPQFVCISATLRLSKITVD